MADELTVVAAAIRASDGQVYQVPQPGRHYDVIKLMIEDGHETPARGEQGFMLSDGRCARRGAAKHVAREAGQLLERASPLPALYSEDVW